MIANWPIALLMGAALAQGCSSDHVPRCTRDANPWTGCWQEKAWLECGSDDEVQPPTLIAELDLKPDESFTVTWEPFESYVDYWGTYQVDTQTNHVLLSVERGNYVPPDVDGEGRIELRNDGQLLLHEMWLGTDKGQAPPSVKPCSQLFSPY